VPSTQKIIEDCRKIQDVAEMIREQSPIPEVPDLAELFGLLAKGVEDLAKEMNGQLSSVSIQAGSALGMIDEHIQDHR
jgi:hypothetical protein